MSVSLLQQKWTTISVKLYADNWSQIFMTDWLQFIFIYFCFIYLFVLTICQDLSALTVRIMAYLSIHTASFPSVCVPLFLCSSISLCPSIKYNVVTDCCFMWKMKRSSCYSLLPSLDPHLGVTVFRYTNTGTSSVWESICHFAIPALHTVTCTCQK